MKKKIILIGSGGHAKSCIDVIEKEGNFIIAGLIGNFSELNKKILNYKVIGTDEDLKKLRKNNKPFGGVQIILIGDLFQLPPVVSSDSKDIMEQLYPDGPYFFNSKTFKEGNIKIYELSKIFRQKEENFINLLNKIRISKISQKDFKKELKIKGANFFKFASNHEDLAQNRSILVQNQAQSTQKISKFCHFSAL